MRPEHPNVFVQPGVVRRNHPTFDSAEVMRVVERKIRNKTQRSYLLSSKRRPMGLASVLDKRHSAIGKSAQQFCGNAVVAENVRQEDGFGARRYFLEHLSIVHTQSSRIDIHEDRLKTAVEDRKSTRLNSSHSQISYAVFCLKKKNKKRRTYTSE